jgi:hypothetical protein
MNDDQSRYLKNTAPKHQKLFARVFAGTATRSAAIKAMCISCVGQEDVREQVGQCEVMVCPLWRFRPYQKQARLAANTPQNGGSGTTNDPDPGE